MVRTEMLTFIEEHPNVPVSHPFFGSDEFIFMDNHLIIRDECGYVFDDGTPERTGMQMRRGGEWEYNWYVKEGVMVENIY